MNKEAMKLCDNGYSVQQTANIEIATKIKGGIQAKLVSPQKVALFWDMDELPKKRIELTFNTYFADLVKVIRIYDVTKIKFNGKNAHHYYEIPVPYKQSYWFVEGLLSNRSYLAEIGISLPEDRFFLLLRSNAVQTPKLDAVVYQAIYHDVIQLRGQEGRRPNRTEYVSTYNYYLQNK